MHEEHMCPFCRPELAHSRRKYFCALCLTSLPVVLRPCVSLKKLFRIVLGSALAGVMEPFLSGLSEQEISGDV